MGGHNSLYRMRRGLLLLLVCLAPVLARNGKRDRIQQKVGLKSRDHGHAPVVQGDCPDGWKDGSSVGLGCVYADMEDANVDEPTAETVCQGFGEGGRLVEIFSEDQVHFLQNMLGLIENDNNFGGYVYWWIGLNDKETEGEWVWPVGGTPDFTNWDVEYDEPYPDPDHQVNCVEMQSAEFFSLLWMSFYCDDTDALYPVCQLP